MHLSPVSQRHDDGLALWKILKEIEIAAAGHLSVPRSEIQGNFLA
jgi:hypothetical protein